MSLVTANGNLCPLCGNQLAVKVAAGGQMPGSRFLRCTNPHSTGQPYFHRFPTTSAPATTASSSPTMASPPSLANPPSSVTSVARRQTCPTPGCQSTRLNSGCSNGVCRKHCMKLGACALGAHKHERECKQQVANTSFPPPLNPLGIYRSHDEWTASTVPARQKLDDYQPLFDAARAARKRELDQLPGVRSPTPEAESVREVYEWEEHELAHALQLSLQDHQSGRAAVPGPSLRLPSSIVTAGTLQPLSDSPDFPTSLRPSIARLRSLSPSPGASSSLFPPPLLLAMRPVPTAAGRKPKAHQITRQLNDDWMGMSTGSSQGPSRVPMATQPSTFHLRKQVSPLLKHFILVFWYKENAPHRVYWIDSVPTWPQWRVSDATGPFADLLADADVDMYTPKYKQWVTINTSFPHTVSFDSILMLRCRDIDCLDFDAVVQNFYPESRHPTSTLHIRTNMPAERSALRSIYKNARTTRSGKPRSADLSYDDDDSDVQVTDVKISKRIKQEDELPYRRQRLHLEPLPLNTNTLIVIDSDSDDELPTMAPSASASASDAAPPWPAGMYVVDMVTGFRQMDSRSLKGLNREERFKRVFGSEVEYHASTFTAQQAKFNKATPTQVKKGVEAGRTTDGLWSVWRKRI
ncbi:hypothetical protein DFH08DRAFT_972473 [Mycena albidolilacea]|uniref:Uncharacterized protein n=1 Tax=Mycena albidolilacea TaxID=1033008 RepID=A0AAD6ZBU7_9AGAR|nr:hypothetical protein DFH08DRAFT_972473 [Mycena albidolilacea]